MVAYDGGNHSFVPHLSNGITFRDCVAHDQAETAFWWDPDERRRSTATRSRPTTCSTSAAWRRTSRPPTAPSTTPRGFILGTGRGNVARGCVATGILGSDESNPGYKWNPDSRDDVNVWTFEDNLSHNNDGSSIYFWINGTPPTLIDRFTAYQDRHGIRAGSYTNLVSYRDMTVYGCKETGILVIAVPGAPEEQPDLELTYENVYVDQAGMTDFAVEISGHVVEAIKATKVTGCAFRGGTKAQVGFPEANEYPQLYEFTDCTFDGTAFWLADDLTEVVDIRVRRRGERGHRRPPGGPGGRPAHRLERRHHADLTRPGPPCSAGPRVARASDVGVERAATSPIVSMSRRPRRAGGPPPRRCVRGRRRPGRGRP